MSVLDAAADPALGSGGSRRELATLAVPAAVFAVLSLAFAVTSEGFLTADALTHYLYAKHAFTEPHYLLDVWGRPFCTALYAVPAALAGRTGVRVASLVLALACAWATYRIARGQGFRWPALAFLLTLGQPLLFLHSFSEMTELPLAALIAFTFWAYQARRWTAAAVLVSLTPLARPEGLGFILLAAVAFLLHRKTWRLLLLPLPLLLWNHAGWEAFGRHGPWWGWLPSQWPYAKNSLYPAGHVLQFVALLPVVVSPLVLPATLLGIWRAFRGGFRAWRGRGRGLQYISQSSPDAKLGRALFAEAAQPAADRTADQERHVQLCRVLTAFVPLFVLTVHSLLYALGKLGSYGEARYLLVVAPFWGLLSARGLEWLWLRLGGETPPLRWAGAAVLLPLPIALALRVLPLPLPDDYRTARRAVEWYSAGAMRTDYPNLIASHPAVYYYLGVSPAGGRPTGDWHRDTIKAHPPGVLLIWDPIYGTRNASADRAFDLAEIQAAGWVHVGGADKVLNEAGGAKVSRTAYHRWNVFRSPQAFGEEPEPKRP